nr:ASKHA domain-containing protein [Candidatus Njordarchaeota archaeon]
MGLITLVFEPDGRRGQFKSRTRLYDAAKELGVGVRSECGGEGTCGKCRIVVVSGLNLLNSLTESEKESLTQKEIEGRYRLCCQAQIKEKEPRITSTITVLVPNESRVGARRIQVKGMEQPVQLNPAIQKLHLTMQRPTITNPMADDEELITRVEEATGLRRLKLSYEVSRILPSVIREANWDVTVTLWNNRQIIEVEAGDNTANNFGASVDIGTSKIVSYIVNLNTGEVLSAGMLENPQIQHGEDVLTRIAYATQSPENQEEIRKLVVDGINTVIESACKDAGDIDMKKIHEVTVVGNTAMTHLFLGIQPRFLSLAPYPPAMKRSTDVEASKTGLRIHPQGNVHVLPCVAGYVGADAVADVIATSIHQKDEMSLLVDVGTNGEVFLGNKKEILSCSCAAGPAFEGTQIEYGMKAVTGAIEKVKINPKTFELKYETIGSEKPIGLCGSAIVDIVAELLKTGTISSRGKFNVETIKTERLIQTKGEGLSRISFVIAWKGETAINKHITVSAKDIGEIQLAKAALHTGCEVLMQKKGVTEKDIDRVYIAGAFGNYINPENAKFIGLVPDVPTKKIKFVGNTAVVGAKMALVSKEASKTAEMLSKKVRYNELAVDPEFNTEFFAAMFIPHKDPSRFPSVSKYFSVIKKT